MTLADFARRNAHVPVTRFVATGVIRPGQALIVDQVGGVTVYVADEDGQDARRYWPLATWCEISNATGTLEPREDGPCVS